MHMQPVFWVEGDKVQCLGDREKGKYKARVVGGEVAQDLFNRGFCLPSGTAMPQEDLERVIRVIKRVGKQL